jgi:hypothetical protein
MDLAAELITVMKDELNLKFNTGLGDISFPSVTEDSEGEPATPLGLPPPPTDLGWTMPTCLFLAFVLINK